MMDFCRAVKSMEGAEHNLANIQELLKNAVFLRQQIKYEEARRYLSSRPCSSVKIGAVLAWD